MPWLLDAAGNVVTRNGRPVLQRDDKSEMEFDGDGALVKITSLNKENQTFRAEKKALEERLEKFGDAEPDDIEAFLTTLEELGGPEGIEKLKAGGNVNVDELKKQIQDGYEAKIAKLKEAHASEIKTKDDHLYKLEVSNRFASSEFIANKLTIPPDIAESTFGKHFKLEDGRCVAYIGDEKVWSKNNPGELADFEEAVEAVVMAYPRKDSILKGSNASGSGLQQSRQKQHQQAPENLSSTQKIAAGLQQLR